MKHLFKLKSWSCFLACGVMMSSACGITKLEDKKEQQQQTNDTTLEEADDAKSVANPIVLKPVVVDPVIVRPVVVTNTQPTESGESSAVVEVPAKITQKRTLASMEGGENVIAFEMDSSDDSLSGSNSQKEALIEGGETTVSFSFDSGDTALSGVNDKKETIYSLDTEVIDTEEDTSAVEVPHKITRQRIFSSIEGGENVFAFELDSEDTSLSGQSQGHDVICFLDSSVNGASGDTTPAGVIEFDMHGVAPIVQGFFSNDIRHGGINLPRITANDLSKLSYFFDAYYTTINEHSEWSSNNIEVPKKYRQLFPNIWGISLVQKYLKQFDYKYYNVVMEGRTSNVTGLVDRVAFLGTKDNNCITYEQLEDVYVAVLGVLLTYVNGAEGKIKESTVYDVAKKIAEACVAQKTNDYKAKQIKAQVQFLTNIAEKKLKKHQLIITL